MDSPAPSATAPLPAEAGRGVLLFVWGVWLAMSLAALLYVVAWRSEYPHQDEWVLIPALTGDDRVTVEALWTQHNEHRMPLVKLAAWTTLLLAGPDFRPAALLNLLVLSGLAAALLLAATRLRGRTVWTDAFLPLTLLHWGHQELFFNVLALNHLLPTVLSAALLVVTLKSPDGPTGRGLLLTAVCLLAIPLCGATGLTCAAATVLWLGVIAVRCWWRGDRGRALALATLVVAFAATLAVCCYGLHPSPAVPPCPGFVAWLKTALLCLGWPAGTLLIPVLLPLWGVVLWRTFRRPEERTRVTGVVLFVGGGLALACLIGWGRSGLSPLAGAAPRYAITLAPVLLSAYLTGCVYGPPRFRRLVQGGLCLVAGALLVPNFVTGWKAARSVYERATAPFARDLRSDTPTDAVAEYASFSVYPDQKYLAFCLRGLRRAGFPTYRGLRDESPTPLAEVPFPVEPTSVHAVGGAAPPWAVTGADSALVFALPEPHLVRGVRLRFRVTQHAGREALAEVAWRRDPGRAVSKERHRLCRWPVGEWQTRAVWIGDTISELRIRPAGEPCAFELAELTLLLPPPPRPGLVAVALPR